MLVLLILLDIVSGLLGLAMLAACFILAGKAADRLGDGFLSLYSFLVCVFLGLAAVPATIVVIASLPGWL